MKILKVTPSFYPAFSYGGPTVTTYELCRNLAALGCEVRVLTTDANGIGQTMEVDQDHEVFFDKGFTVRYCHRLLRHSVSPTLIRLLPQYVAWADVVHLDYVYSFPTLPTHFQCCFSRKPLLWSPHGALSRWAQSSRVGLKELWDSVWYHETDLQHLLVQLTSEQEEKNALARFPQLPTAVVPNGVDVPAELNRVPRTKQLRMLFLGRVDPIKGLENLLQACRLLLGKSPAMEWHLTIAGSGKSGYLAQIKQLVAQLELGNKVSMLGEVTDSHKKNLFESSDVAIVPSNTENFGMVIAEALAHGVPVIASKGTPWSRVQEQGCGLWVENAPESLAKAIQRMASMPLQEMGLKGREWMRAEFLWSAVARRMLALYQGLADHSSG